MNAALALFETRKDNLAIADSGNRTPEGAQAYIAHDSTKTKGWELELAGEIAPGWSVQGGYTRVLSRDSSGNRLNTLHPLHQVKLFSTYTPSSMPRLTLGGGLNWQSKIYSTAADSVGLRRYLTQSGYAVVNVMGRYQIGRGMDLAVGINNLLNKDYYAHVDHYGIGYGAERNFYASVKYSF
uniref:TonB-dependent receptor domain-containing protein n=1 Tax=Thauera sp. SDU_THAU2 TaxID=3136633 RepID=UPI00311F8311